MTNKPENPSAFPHTEHDRYGQRHPIQNEGMSLRDYFAAGALQGLLAYEGISSNRKEPEAFAAAAYAVADAMLEQRTKG